MTEVTPSRIFVVIEGNEGCGKTTLVQAIQEKVTADGIDAVFTREPGGTQLAEELRFIAKGRRSEVVNPVTDLLIVQAARTQNIDNVIRPALQAGKWVVTDRFIQSTWCLNVAPFLETHPQLPDVFMGLMPHVFGAELPEPLVFVVDIPEETRLARLAERADEDDRYAERDELTVARTAAAYKSISAGPNTLVIDGTLPIEEQVEIVFSTIDAFKVKLVEAEEEQRRRQEEQLNNPPPGLDGSTDEDVTFTESEDTTPSAPVEEVPFDLEVALEEYVNTNVIPELFEGDDTLVPYYKGLAKDIVRIIFEETGGDKTIFHPMRIGELNRNIHSMFHFHEQLNKWKGRVLATKPQGPDEAAVDEAVSSVVRDPETGVITVNTVVKE